MVIDTEHARWMLYEATYRNIEQLFRCILGRALRSREDKEQTLVKLFELLEPFSNRPIGKRFERNQIYDMKGETIKPIARVRRKLLNSKR